MRNILRGYIQIIDKKEYEAKMLELFFSTSQRTKWIDLSKSFDISLRVLNISVHVLSVRMCTIINGTKMLVVLCIKNSKCVIFLF